MLRHGLGHELWTRGPAAGWLWATVFCATAAAQPASWRGDGVAPLPQGTRSVVVLRDDEPLFQKPSVKAPRRGAAELGARLPLFGARRGPGCSGRFLRVGSSAWICEQGIEPSTDQAPPLDRAPRATPDGLPHPYYFVSPEGSFGYRALATAEDGVPETQYQPGFGVAITRTAHKPGGDRFGLTTHRFWVPMRDLHPVRPVAFEGSPWSDDLGWVIHDGAPVYQGPGRIAPTPKLDRLTTLHLLETRKQGGASYSRIGPDRWVRDRDVRQPSLKSPPPELRPGERWLDVDLARQTLVAYIGDRPVYATLVSTGRGPAKSQTATPPGTYRIWVKLRMSDMDNLENLEARENYAIESVPWVMFFHKGYGLHGTFWHRQFGSVKSHGCVNLAPRDAERLFYFTGPQLPTGWKAVLPTEHEPGTLIRIRSQ